MAETYTYATQSQAVAELQGRLANLVFDDTQKFWDPLAELPAYVNEALQTWNAMTGGYWRQDFVFSTIANQTFYDITTVAGSLRSMNTSDAALI